MGKPAKDSFDAQFFLGKVGAGKSILEFKKGQNVFVQGDRADAVFYIQKGRITLTVISDLGKEAVVGIHLIPQAGNRCEEHCCPFYIVLGPAQHVARVGAHIMPGLGFPTLQPKPDRRRTEKIVDKWTAPRKRDTVISVTGYPGG
jgi:CRP-like cAMP-binding protein